MAGKYKIELRGKDREFTNELNKIFDQIEQDIKAAQTPATASTTTQSKSNG